MSFLDLDISRSYISYGDDNIASAFLNPVLSHTKLYRRSVGLYYAVSPAIVKWFGHTGWFKRLWRKRLDRWVSKLNSQGVENTPYKDRKW